MLGDTIPIGRLRAEALQDDRRAHRRIPCKLVLCCRSLKRRRFPLHLIAVTDISTNGAGLILEKRIEPRTVFAIEIQRRQSVTRTLLARVTHATKNPDGTWTVGCEFAGRLTHRELQELLS